MYWYLGMDLTDAFNHLTGLRACNPKLDVIRHATCDLLFGTQFRTVRVGLRAPPATQSVSVAGLDMGWGSSAECSKMDGNEDLFVLERELPTGRSMYKFIVDGTWTHDEDAPMCLDGDNTNNYIDVSGTGSNADAVADADAEEVRQRVMSEASPLTHAEREKLREVLDDKVNATPFPAYGADASTVS